MTTCLHCASSETIPMEGFERYPLSRCGSCGLVFATGWNAGLDQKGFDPSHEDYYQHRLGNGTVEQGFTEVNMARQRALLKSLGRHAPQRSLLDLGCGFGELVMTAQAEGWEALGIDLSETATAFARSRGGHCSTLNFFDPTLETQRFGVILMCEFLEHVASPLRFLERARSLLLPGGVVYVTTPNFSSLSRRMLGADWGVIGPGHIAYYSTGSLSRIAGEAGLRPLRVETRNVSLGTLRAVRSRLPSFRPASTSRPAASAAAPGWYAENQAFRARLRSNAISRLAVASANRALNLFSAGDTLTALLVAR